MHFTDTRQQGGSKFGKLAVVAAVHVAIGAVFIHTINSRGVVMPTVPEALVVLLPPEPLPPLPPPDPPKAMPLPTTAPPPQIVVPLVEVQVQQPPPANTITAVLASDPIPQAPAPTPAAAAPGPATPVHRKAGVRSVALADASGCVTPNYPVRAARNNESGTVTLALLVGVDGRVSDARIKSSSGSRELDKAAIAALSTCTFKPAMQDGVAEPGWAQIAYVWTLE